MGLWRSTNFYCLGAGSFELSELSEFIQKQYNARFEHTSSVAHFPVHVGLVAQIDFGKKSTFFGGFNVCF